jgi:type VI secretion system secreted protein VgrG
MADFSQTNRIIAIDTNLGDDKALLTRLDGEDVLSRCFLYRISIITEQPDNFVQSLLGMPVTLWLQNNNPDLRRPIHGHVRQLVAEGRTVRSDGLYQLEVVPRLWFLSCTSDCRIFQNLNIPDIIKTVLTEHGLTDFEFRVVREDYPPLDYCVQYQETALNFVSRLMEHLGLFYWHEHSADRHLLVIADRNAATGTTAQSNLKISPTSETGELQTLKVESTFRPGRWALNDYDFQSPTKLLRSNTPTTLTVPRMVDHEMYEYPGKYTEQDHGRKLTRLRIEMEEAQQHRVFGTGCCPSFDPGRRFTVAPASGGGRYLLTEVRHHATAPAAESGGDQPSYSNEFAAIKADVPFRPERLTPRPKVHGSQTATVVGPPGENIFCDIFGRVRVQFHWDRRGQRNDQSSCWIRVAQTRAGSYYGSQVLPHVGHEVIVTFLEGDPDRPVITGTLPNALTMPPMELPLDKEKTIERDHGDNKIVMQGKAGSQHLSLVSPRELNVMASGRTARPVGAFPPAPRIPPPPAPTTTSVTFNLDPNTPLVGDVVNVFKDPVGLAELYLGWYGLTWGAPGNNYLPASDLAGSGQTGPDVVQDEISDDSYVNSASEGRINSLALGNNNNWVFKDANTWVNGNAFTQVNGNASAVVGGTGFGGTSTSSVNTTEVWGDNITYAHHDNITTADHNNVTNVPSGENLTNVNGENTTLVIGSNWTVVTPNNFQFIDGLNTSITLGVNTALTIGVNIAVNVILSLAQTGIALSQTMIQNQTATYDLQEKGAKITTVGAAIEAGGLKMFL